MSLDCYGRGVIYHAADVHYSICRARRHLGQVALLVVRRRTLFFVAHCLEFLSADLQTALPLPIFSGLCVHVLCSLSFSFYSECTYPLFVFHTHCGELKKIRMQINRVG